MDLSSVPKSGLGCFKRLETRLDQPSIATGLQLQSKPSGDQSGCGCLNFEKVQRLLATGLLEDWSEV